MEQAEPIRIRASRRITSVKGHLIPLSLSAVLLGLSFPPVGWWPLAYVALAPVGVLAARAAGQRRLIWTSWLVWFVFWLVMASWLIPVTVGGYVAVSLLQGAFMAIAVVTLWFVQRRFGGAMTLTLPLVWTAVELLRGNFPEGGFNWFIVGHTQASYLVEQGAGRVVQVADLFGQTGVSFVVLMTSGLIADLLTRPLLRSRGGKTRLRKTIRVALLLWAAALVGGMIYGQVRIGQWESDTTVGMTVAVIQTNVPQDNKNYRTPEQTAADWAEMLALTEEALAQSENTELVVWPETMVPMAINAQTRGLTQALTGADKSVSGDQDFAWIARDYAAIYHRQIADIATRHGVSLLVGAPSWSDWQWVEFRPGEWFFFYTSPTNSVYLYTPDGVQAETRYDKIHLVPFGEYLPWVDAAPWLKSFFLNYISPIPVDYSLRRGEHFDAFDLPADRGRGIVRVATPICYEDVSPGITRRQAYGGGDDAERSKRIELFVNVTNSAWYSGSGQRQQHLQIATIRSIENRIPTARSVNAGISGFIDSVGRVGPVVEVGGQRQRVAGWATHAVRYDTRSTFFGHVGRWPMAGLALLAAGLVIAGALRRGKMRRGSSRN